MLLMTSKGVENVSSIATDDIPKVLLNEFGPYIPVSKVWRLLSYPSLDAARKAFKRNVAPMQRVEIPGRRGDYIKTLELVGWLEKSRNESPATNL